MLFQTIWLSFLGRTQKNFSRMSKLFFSIRWKRMLTTFILWKKSSSTIAPLERKSIWKYMRVSKWSKNFHFPINGEMWTEKTINLSFSVCSTAVLPAFVSEVSYTADYFIDIFHFLLFILDVNHYHSSVYNDRIHREPHPRLKTQSFTLTLSLRISFKCRSDQKWKFCPRLLALVSFQTCIALFLPWNTKEDFDSRKSMLF